jgi:hypothetical protein
VPITVEVPYNEPNEDVHEDVGEQEECECFPIGGL